MYSTRPPTRATFNPRISSLAKMPSPPPALRSLVHRLNRTPARARTPRASNFVKPEPVDTPNHHSSDSEHLPLGPHLRSASQNNNTDRSVLSSASTATPDNSALSQALVNLLNTPPAANTTPVLDFQGCRVEIHFHVHPAVRPAFPLPYSRMEQLKRKREGEDLDQVPEGAEILERQVKKIKLSHDTEPGYRIRGRATTRNRSERVTTADGVKARSRAGLRRMSSRVLETDRVRR